MFAPHPDELQQLKTASDALQSLREFLALDEEVDVEAAREALTQIEQVLIARNAIEQAKGAIRALEGGTADEALAKLVEESQSRNVTLQSVAVELLNSLGESR